MNAITIGGFGRSDQPQTMSTKEIADLTGKRHDNVMRDTRAMLIELKGEEALLKFEGSYVGQDNSTRPCFNLPKRETLVLVSGYNLTMRAAIIDRWQELEANAAQPDPLAALNDPATMRGLLLNYSEKVIMLEQANAELAPKADALDLLSASSGSVTFTQAAKLLGVKQDTMTKWMHANGWIYRQNGSWVAYSQQIQNGRLEYKEANYTNQTTGMKCVKPYCHITPKGLAKLAVIFGAGDKKAA